MPLIEKLSELEQRHAKLHAEAREITEKCEKENRIMTIDEMDRFEHLCGSSSNGSNGQGGELFELAARIQNIRRLNATDRIGLDPRSGLDPLEQRISNPLPHEDPLNTRNGRHRYSMMKACRDLLFGGGQLTGLEREVSEQLEERTQMGKAIGGFKMPWFDQSLTSNDLERMKRFNDLRTRGMVDERPIPRPMPRSNFERRNLHTVIAGAGSIPTILDQDWIELLRNRMIVMAAGAQEITDLRGKFAIPRQSAAATAYWVAEGAAPTGTNQTLDQVLFVPHTLGAFTDINRRFFELTILESGEAFVKADLTAILGRGLDLAALNGSGSANQPLGILQNTGITSTRTVALGVNGGLPTWPAMVELHTVVSRGNASDLGEFVYVGNADVRGTLATVAKLGTTFPYFILDDNQRVYSFRTEFSQQLPNNLTKGTSGPTLSPIIGGVWNQLYFAYWSGIDILVDPYTGSSAGTIRIVSLVDADIQTRHNEAFAVIVDMMSNQTQ